MRMKDLAISVAIQISISIQETVVCDYIAAMSDRYAVKVFSDIYIPKGWQEKSREF